MSIVGQLTQMTDHIQMTEIIKYISIFFYYVLFFLIYTANLKCLCSPWLAHEQNCL